MESPNTPKYDSEVVSPHKERLKLLKKAIKRYYGFYILLLLPVLYYVIFKYVPMIGNVLAFRKYSPKNPMFGTEWVSLHYFMQFLTSSDFWVKFQNTIILSIGTTAVCFPIPIIFALMLNEFRGNKFKRFVQTSSYLPHFLSTVVVVGMIMQILSPNSGVINLIRAKLGMPIINFMTEPGWFRFIYIMSQVWQTMGWSAIIYIAALSGVDPELYEAAMIDGANRFKQALYITIPGIAHSVIICLIMSIGGIMSVGTEKILLMQNDLNIATSDVIGTYVYRVGLIGNNYSFSTAVGLFESVIGLILITGANYLSRKITDMSLW